MSISSFRNTSPEFFKECFHEDFIQSYDGSTEGCKVGAAWFEKHSISRMSWPDNASISTAKTKGIYFKSYISQETSNVDLFSYLISLIFDN